VDPGPRARRALRNLVPVAVAGLGYGLLRGGAGLGTAGSDPFEPGVRALIALQALGTYALMGADPLRPRLQIGLLGDVESLPVCLGIAVLLASGLALAVAWRRRNEPALVALTLSGTALLPALHLIPLPLRVVAADRFLYLPAAALALLAAACAAGFADRLGSGGRKSTLVGAGLLLALFMTATSAQSRAWTDEVELWRSAAAQAHPENPQPWSLLGEALLRRGDAAEALQVTRESLRRNDALRRRFPWADGSDGIRGNLAGCLAALGRYSEAVELMRGLVLRKPDSAKHRYNLGVLYARALRFDDALRELDTALVLRPGDGRARGTRLAVARARDLWRTLPKERPDEAASVRAARAWVYEDLGRREESRRLWQRVADDPTSPSALASEARTLAAR
jgi:tetratricopeptide (TPR) repeat protein